MVTRRRTALDTAGTVVLHADSGRRAGAVEQSGGPVDRRGVLPPKRRRLSPPSHGERRENHEEAGPPGSSSDLIRM